MNLGQYTLELTTTPSCNFRCSYCFENDYIEKQENLLVKNQSLIVQRIKELLNDSWFKETFDSLQISFWGGEPTLNIDFINYIVDNFKDDPRVGFFIYTNGSKIEELLPTLIVCKNYDVGKKIKFRVQISYDGNPVNDLNRTPKDKTKISSEIVYKALEILDQNDIDFSLKPTLRNEDYKYLPEIWDDFYRLYMKYKDNIRYAVTIDYHHIPQKLNENELENALLQVAKKEYHFFKKEGRMLSTIFEDKKDLCSAGKKIACVNIDGSVYFCHGCIYSSKKDDFKYSQFFNEQIIDDIKKQYLSFSNRYNEECSNCVALYCLRCNVKKYEQSLQNEFFDKWYDFCSQPQLCNFYKISGRIGRALYRKLQKEEK